MCSKSLASASFLPLERNSLTLYPLEGLERGPSVEDSPFLTKFDKESIFFLI